jgi:hypothetical protein
MDTFERLPAHGPAPQLTFFHDALRPSAVRLPMNAKLMRDHVQ